MAASPTLPGGVPTPHTPFLTDPCNQCLVIMLGLASLTAIFMVLCLSLSFTLARRSQRPGRRVAIASAPPAMDLWASPPLSHSQTTLLLTEAISLNRTPEPEPDPILCTDWEWVEAMARQPRVTIQDIDQFWWRSHATAV